MKRYGKLICAAIALLLCLCLPLPAAAQCSTGSCQQSYAAAPCNSVVCSLPFGETSLYDLLHSLLPLLYTDTNNCPTDSASCGNGGASCTADIPTAVTAERIPNSKTAADTGVSDTAAEVLRLINQERSAIGLAALSMDEELCAAAAIRAAESGRYFSHTRPDGRSCFSVFTDQGIDYRSAGENLAIGQRSAQQAVRDWMNSEGHRANIVSRKYGRTGIAVIPAEGAYSGYVWVQLFAD